MLHVPERVQIFRHVINVLLFFQKNSVAFSPQANYTDWATATDRRILLPTFADRGVSRGQRGGTPMVVNFSCINRSLYFIML
jgi:hypothetical protein